MSATEVPNPPCTTLHVGNLPTDASEDELKAMFSKQRGYQRLIFGTKQNGPGPMCFAEFEDIPSATEALNELSGVRLHSGADGGLRLSFGKNPLGVRAGHPTSASSATHPDDLDAFDLMPQEPGNKLQLPAQVASDMNLPAGSDLPLI